MTKHICKQCGREYEDDYQHYSICDCCCNENSRWKAEKMVSIFDEGIDPEWLAEYEENRK